MNRLVRLALRTLLPIIIAVLASACGSILGSDAKGQIMVVDALGMPLKGAVVLPDPETQSAALPNYSESELRDRSTNAQGVILVYLEDFYWDSDGCYHIHVHKGGYEDVTISVSKDLFPSVLRIEIKPGVPAASPVPGTRNSLRRAKPGFG